MSVEKTYEWFEKSSSMYELSSYILPFFKEASIKDNMAIVKHLQTHGMFRFWKEGQKTQQELKKNNIFRFVKQEEQLLRNKWNGPDVPIIILPVDEKNRKIRVKFGSKSGLAFHDKLFLFLSAHSTKESISAIMTHEYNHICRLEKMPKEEKDMTLLDTMILEGLAENAVHERLGESETAKWVTLYSQKQLEHFQTRMLKPYFGLHRQDERLFSSLMYGKGYFPEMLGYAVGYNIVNQYLLKKRAKVGNVLSLSAESFLLT
ncbi:DUF2268 domain-containing protein [Bacillus sp. CLL-7-23]|uniref:DUF2268 domain-containing protein n=1 Tax=Bacillus changyiensis TaxID=3004103 RepID=A0ABT4X1D1_9BACI|nr:DUF2268 domain-containing protein [Bacillus changyiensis]MDA7026087.1 DUF2268 domain-containing protein [Bacillus changyiensis]